MAHGDLTQCDISAMQPTRFEYAAKEAWIIMRLPGELLAAIKRAAMMCARNGHAFWH